MMRRPKKLLATARENAARFVVESLTVLGRAQSMVRNLWNRTPTKSQLVHGCSVCGIIYRFDVFYWGDAEDTGLCPCCGSEFVLDLGHIPETTIDETGIYLIGRDGCCTGPYKSEDDAQDHLWHWFAQKEQEDGQEDHQEEKRRKAWGHLRLVIDENEVCFPSKEEAAKDLADCIAYGFEAERRRRHRCVDAEDGNGQEMEREGTDQES